MHIRIARVPFADATIFSRKEYRISGTVPNCEGLAPEQERERLGGSPVCAGRAVGVDVHGRGCGRVAVIICRKRHSEAEVEREVISRYGRHTTLHVFESKSVANHFLDGLDDHTDADE